MPAPAEAEARHQKATTYLWRPGGLAVSCGVPSENVGLIQNISGEGIHGSSRDTECLGSVGVKKKQLQRNLDIEMELGLYRGSYVL